MKARNAIFSAILCILMAGPLLLLATQEAAKAELPSWLTAEDAIQLAGGVADDNVEEHVSLAGFQEGKLQNALSGTVSNHIPLKASALLGRTSAYRQLIETSKGLFGYDIAPTEIGSQYLYIDEVDAVSYIPIGLDPQMKQGIRNLVTGAKRFADENPDIDVVVYVVGGYQNPAVSPVYDIDPSGSFEDIMAFCADVAEESPSNMYLLGSEYDSLTEYYQDFFRTDHHWNARGALKAYEQIADVLGMPAIEAAGETYFDDYRFSGSLGRASLYQVEEIPFDLNIDFSNLRLVDAEGNFVMDAGHESYWSSARPGLIRDFYDSYYDNLSLNAIVGGSGARNICLISNSYGGGIQRLLAQGSTRLQACRDLHPSYAGGTTLASRVASADYDTVILMASPKDLSILGNNHPEYFN